MDADIGLYKLVTLGARLALDLCVMGSLLFDLYYRRYRDKELVTAASLFNVFVFSVLTILSEIQFSIAAGFGLFAILALFTLRSEPISKIEMPYFFGSVAVAVICSVQGTTLPLVVVCSLVVLAGAYVLDHPRMLRSVDSIKITLDRIEKASLSDPEALRASLSKRLGVAVTNFQILQLDYVNETARVNVYFKRQEIARTRANNGLDSPEATATQTRSDAASL